MTPATPRQRCVALVTAAVDEDVPTVRQLAQEAEPLDVEHLAILAGWAVDVLAARLGVEVDVLLDRMGRAAIPTHATPPDGGPTGAAAGAFLDPEALVRSATLDELLAVLTGLGFDWRVRYGSAITLKEARGEVLANREAVKALRFAAQYHDHATVPSAGGTEGTVEDRRRPGGLEGGRHGQL